MCRQKHIYINRKACALFFLVFKSMKELLKSDLLRGPGELKQTWISRFYHDKNDQVRRVNPTEPDALKKKKKRPEKEGNKLMHQLKLIISTSVYSNF